MAGSPPTVSPPIPLSTSFHPRPRITSVRPRSGFVRDRSYYVWDARFGFVELRDRVAGDGEACAVTGQRIPAGLHCLASVEHARGLRLSYRGFLAVQHENPLS